MDTFPYDMQLYLYYTLQYTLLIKKKRSAKKESINGKEKSIMIVEPFIMNLQFRTCSSCNDLYYTGRF